MAAERRRPYPNKCRVCGRFLANVDPYGDQHTSLEHPEEHRAEMEAFQRRQAARAAGSR